MNLPQVSNLYQLFRALQEVGEIAGSRATYSAAELQHRIVEAINLGKEEDFNRVTKTHGLRSKVRELKRPECRPMVDWFLLHATGYHPYLSESERDPHRKLWPMEDWPRPKEWMQEATYDEADQVLRTCTLFPDEDGGMEEFYIRQVLQVVDRAQRETDISRTV